MELYHHGVKGQKWGVRRYRNENGQLTPEGLIRLVDDYRTVRKKEKEFNEKVKRVDRKIAKRFKVEKAKDIPKKYADDIINKKATRKGSVKDFLNRSSGLIVEDLAIGNVKKAGNSFVSKLLDDEWGDYLFYYKGKYNE